MQLKRFGRWSLVSLVVLLPAVHVGAAGAGRAPLLDAVKRDTAAVRAL